MNDSERLDAIIKHDFCISSQQVVIDGTLTFKWGVLYSIGGSDQRVMVSDNLRTAIDAAVLDIKASKTTQH